MDEVLADTLVQFLRYYNDEHGTAFSKQDVEGKKFCDVVPSAHKTKVQRYPLSPGFFRDIPVMAQSQDTVMALNGVYEVFIATAAMEYPNSFAPKYEWLKEHFPFIPDSHIVFCGDKSIVAADYLIDDSPRHFSRFKGEGILFTASHNIGDDRYYRVNHWDDVRRRFLSPDH